MLAAIRRSMPFEIDISTQLPGDAGPKPLVQVRLYDSQIEFAKL